MANDYYKGVNTLAPTTNIKDPHVRAFADSLANAWELRNGNVGSDDNQRFITKQEWDYLAKNPTILAIAGIGQPGSSVPINDGGGSLPPLPPEVQNAIDFLVSGITLIDIRQAFIKNNELFANYFSLVSQIRNEITNIDNTVSGLEDDITQINTITKDSTSASAQTLWALKETVHDPLTGLEQAHAYIVEINKMDVSSTSANAQHTLALEASVTNVNNSNLLNTAAIIQINNVSATSTSANAKQLNGLSASVGYNPATGVAQATADISQINYVNVNSTSANARIVAGMSAQVDNNLAMINAINDVKATSTSASARQLSGVMALSGFKSRVFVANTAPVSTSSYTLVFGDLWINPSNNNFMNMWNGTAWQDASDARLAYAQSGVINEANARTSSDTALANATNLVWGVIGNTNALVQGTSAVNVNPGHGQASNFIQVQTALTDPVTGQIVAAAGRAAFDNFVSADTKRATSAYTLQVQAQSGGTLAVAGMQLYANAGPGSGSAGVVFLAPAFAIYNRAPTGDQLLPPFSIFNNQIRMSAAYIRDYIQSDNFVTRSTGWIIRQDGSAEFNNTVVFGSIVSGSVMIDYDSRIAMSTTAVGSYNSHGIDGSYPPKPISSLTFYGPNRHGSSDFFHRVRQTQRNGVNCAYTVTWMGVADDRVTIWARYNNGPWSALASTTTPAIDYGAATCGFSGDLQMAPDGFYQFSVTATDANHQPGNSGKQELREFNMVVTVSNM